jgi:hypothetical protein
MMSTKKACLFAAVKSEAFAALLCALIFTAVALVAIEYALPEPPQQVAQRVVK